MSSDPKKLEYMDAVRGIAILMVILVHTSQGFSFLSKPMRALADYGQMGVQLFFVASAYTLCLAYSQRSGEPRPYQSFLIRRFFRIAPLYYFAILLYYQIHCVQAWLLKYPVFVFGPYSANNLLANILFVHGFVPGANNTIVPGGWSIGTEMAFYLLFPSIYLFCTRSHTGALKRAYLAFGASLILSLAFEVGSLMVQGRGVENNRFVYLNLLNQLPVFCLGLIAYFHNKSLPGEGGTVTTNVVAFLACSAGAELLWCSNLAYSFAVIPVLSGLSFVFLLRVLSVISLGREFLGALGRASYSMYVFHFVFAWYLVRPINRALLLVLPDDVAFLVVYLLVVASTFMVAKVSVPWIEAQGIHYGRKFINSRNGGRLCQ